MNDLSPKQQRESLLVALYDQTNGSMSESFETDLAAQSIGLEPDRASDLAVVLKNSGYIDTLTFGGTGFLSARGISEAERFKERVPDASGAPVAVLLTRSERADLEAFVTDLERAAIAEKLSGDDLLEYRADLETARAQAVSPRPKRNVVRVVVHRLVEFATQTGAAVTAAIVAKAIGL